MACLAAQHLQDHLALLAISLPTTPCVTHVAIYLLSQVLHLPPYTHLPSPALKEVLSLK